MDAMQLVPEKYVLDIKIPGLPAMYNGIGHKSHWVKVRNTNEWKQNVRAAVGRFLPAEPLKSAKVKFLRCSSCEPDFENNAQSFKPVLDGLVECGVLSDDSPRVVGKPDYDWKSAPKGKGFIQIRVEEIV
jgi:hypothetical protein